MSQAEFIVFYPARAIDLVHSDMFVRKSVMLVCRLFVSLVFGTHEVAYSIKDGHL